MSEEIIKILDDLGKRFGIAIDWSSDNIIPYLQDLMQRFIQYKNVTAIMRIVFFTLALIISVIVLVKTIKWAYKNKIDDFDDEWYIFVCGVSISAIMIAVSIAIIILDISCLIQNTYIPELTIIQYLQEYIKQ